MTLSQKFFWVLQICEPASHASQGVSHASHASHMSQSQNFKNFHLLQFLAWEQEQEQPNKMNTNAIIIQFLQRLHKPSPKHVLISQWEQEQEQQNMIIKFLQWLHKLSPRRFMNQPIRSQAEKIKKLHILLPVKMPLNAAWKTFVALSWVFLKGKVYLNVMNIKTEHIWLSRWFLSIALRIPTAQETHTIKFQPNDHNMPTQHVATLLGARCWVHNGTMYRCLEHFSYLTHQQ